MSSRRIQAMAQLIEDIETKIDAWYREGHNPADAIHAIAVKLAGYRKEFTHPTPKKETP